MNRGRTLLLIAVLIASIGGLAGYLLRAHEPSYGGRGLSAWLRDFEAEQSDTRARAAEAMMHIGPQAVPFLAERLSLPSAARRKESSLEQLRQRAVEWLSKLSVMKPLSVRRPDPRRQALAALDALGPAAKEALPALEKLIHEDPPDPRVPYVVARIGPAGVPLLLGMLTNDVKILRLEARVCMDMLTNHSATLYGDIGLGPDANLFERRLCEFNSRTLRAAFEEYRALHPEQYSPKDVFESPAHSPLPLDTEHGIPPEIESWMTNQARRVSSGPPPSSFE